jgi:hypothetical protein
MIMAVAGRFARILGNLALPEINLAEKPNDPGTRLGEVVVS